MKINDKALAGLLVAVGLFSAGVASRYVANLSTSEKETLLSSLQKSNICPVQAGSGSVLSLKSADGGTVLSIKVNRAV